MNILWNRKVWDYWIYQVEVDGLIYNITAHNCERVGAWGSWPDGTQVIVFGSMT